MPKSFHIPFTGKVAIIACLQYILFLSSYRVCVFLSCCTLRPSVCVTSRRSRRQIMASSAWLCDAPWQQRSAYQAGLSVGLSPSDTIPRYWHYLLQLHVPENFTFGFIGFTSGTHCDCHHKAVTGGGGGGVRTGRERSLQQQHLSRVGGNEWVVYFCKLLSVSDNSNSVLEELRVKRLDWIAFCRLVFFLFSCTVNRWVMLRLSLVDERSCVKFMQLQQ